MKSPYVRKRELERELEILMVDEAHFKKHPTKPRQWKRLKEERDVKDKIFFLTMEKLIIEDCIGYFEKHDAVHAVRETEAKDV